MRNTNWNMVLACATLAVAGVSLPPVGRAAEVHLLEADPACIGERLGRVRVTVGEENPDPRRGGSLPSVGYKRVFGKLRAAAGERGADAVILRGHQADYFAKGSRRPSRPTYIALEGLAVRLEVTADQCTLAWLDPEEFEQTALKGRRENVSKNAGVSF